MLKLSQSAFVQDYPTGVFMIVCLSLSLVILVALALYLWSVRKDDLSAFSDLCESNSRLYSTPLITPELKTYRKQVLDLPLIRR
ncbi:hypothetical protein BLNAU_9219 [Blattamonas nauphoetae]|uniref:Uncharacterized protein n=1 Tax=Blattamonas nauphoetae TaxID=2049346 RepID=A0ABQ9XWK8_9EUKA|nr:hypothetical protein BLNAU_9219 [Blattamonas nauphoetae]